MGVELLGKEVRFLVPMLRDSDRQLHDVAQWEWIEDEMHVRYPNGWQQREVERTENTVKGTVRGRWFDKEKQESVPDDCVEFVVALPPDEMTGLFALFEEICARFDQKCLYFTTGGDAALYHPTNEPKVATDPEKG
jgi:hypothetical protein